MSLKTTCILTGQEKFVRPDVLQKRIEKYGNAETLKKLYICQEASTLLKEGLTVAEVRAYMGSKLETEVPQEALDFVYKNAGKNTKIGKSMNTAKKEVEEVKTEVQDEAKLELKEEATSDADIQEADPVSNDAPEAPSEEVSQLTEEESYAAMAAMDPSSGNGPVKSKKEKKKNKKK